jgi:hypothetical protein
MIGQLQTGEGSCRMPQTNEGPETTYLETRAVAHCHAEVRGLRMDRLKSAHAIVASVITWLLVTAVLWLIKRLNGSCGYFTPSLCDQFPRHSKVCHWPFGIKPRSMRS